MWVCFTSVVFEGEFTSLYNAEICGVRTMLMWAPAGIPPGNCAAPVPPSCIWYGSKTVLEGQAILRHPDLTEEQNKEIDRISDTIAYQRMNEPDADEHKE